jgi:hypothetical protein
MSEKLTLFGDEIANLILTPGEADRKVFAPPFSKGGQGVGQRPTITSRAFFESLNYAPTKWSASRGLAFAVGKSAFTFLR